MKAEKTNVTTSKCYKHVVVCAGRIIEFLYENENEEFNAFTISDKLQIPYSSVRGTLRRLLKSQKIKSVHRGFYSAKIILDKHQIQKIDNQINLEYHNIQFWIPKIGADECYNTPPTVPPPCNIQNSPECYKNVTDCYNDVTQLLQSEIIEINPNQRITIIENSDHYDVILGASKNPLNHREGAWLDIVLKLKFGEEALSKAYLVKYDINHDAVNIQWSPGQTTYGDFEGSVIAIYQKGEVIRFEGRNITVRKTYRAFLDELRDRIPADEEEEPVAAVKDKAQQPQQEKPPISVFRTGLEIFRERYGCSPQKWYEDQARRGI